MRWLAALPLAVSIATAAEAAPNICKLAPEVLACFHPEDTYLTCSELRRNHAKVYFRGSILGRAYQLEYSIERRHNAAERVMYSRVLLLSDNAILPPSPQCMYGEWMPWK